MEAKKQEKTNIFRRIRSSFSGFIEKLNRNKFLFSELVKRDFKKKYKRTVLGMLWSVLSPLLTLLVMRTVFTKFFGSGIRYYTTFLFCGNICFSYFSDSTNLGMGSLYSNAAVFTKINVPKYLFLLSQNVSSLINFGLTFCVFLIFCGIDGVPFTPKFFMLIFPIIALIIFNLGVGMILSALFIFFRDIQYLWGVFTTLLMYVSAIFYDPARFESMESLFYLNPVYVCIKYFRWVTIGAGGMGNYIENGQLIQTVCIPSLQYHVLMFGYAFLALGIGALIYKKNNHKFLYYV